MSAPESCPECGSDDYDETEPDDETARRLPGVAIYVCRECGTAWDAEEPRG